MPNTKSIKVIDDDYEFLHVVSERMNITMGEALHMCLTFKKSSREERMIARLLYKVVEKPNPPIKKPNFIERLRQIWNK